MVNHRDESIRVMHPLFRAVEGGPSPTSSLSAKALWIDKIPFTNARECNRAWHSRLPELGTGAIKNPGRRFLCFGARLGERLCAVAIWSAPVARELPQQDWLELRRLATASDAPRNTCSRMLRVMEILIRKTLTHITRLISYQDTEVHSGAIYKAAGWVRTTLKPGAEWDCPSRSRPKAQTAADKRRWEKSLRSPDP